MFKKLLCTMLAVVMILTTCVLSVSAAEINDESVAADTDISGSGTSGTVSFTVPSGWANFTYIACHLYQYGGTGDAFFPWGSSKERCKQDGDKWVYDLSTLDKSTTIEGGLKSGVAYCIMFRTDTGAETAASTFDTGAIGASFSCPGSTQENAVDSSKTSLVLNCNKSGYGTVLQISSLGNIIGSALPYGYTKQKIYDEWVADESNITNALLYSTEYKTEKELKAGIAKGLGLSTSSSSSSSSGSSSGSSSSTPSKEVSTKDYTTNSKGQIVDKKTGKVVTGVTLVNEDGEVVASSGAVSTGEESTYLFVIAGVMLMAAAAFVFTRKRKIEE